jgi:putative membrane protein
MIVRLYLTLFLIFVLLAIAFIFGSQNDQLLTLNYLVARTQVTVAAAVSLFTGLGFLLGLLVTILWRIVRKSKKALSKNKSQEK